MNDAQAAPGESLLPASTDIFTITVFVLILLFAVAAIAIIVIGARRKRRRVAAAATVQERIEQAAAAPPPAPAPSPAPPPIAAVPAARAAAELPAAAPLADEPIVAASPGEASPAAEAIPGATVDDPADGSVTQLKGLGPKVATRLAELGVTTVGDLAALSADEASRLDAQLGAFSGRMGRDRWLEQARLLAAGDRAGFEAVFGRL